MIRELDRPGARDDGVHARPELPVEQGAHGPREGGIPDRVYPSREAARKEANSEGARFPQVKAEGPRKMNCGHVSLVETGLGKKDGDPGAYGRLGELYLADIAFREPDPEGRVEDDARGRADGRKRAVEPDQPGLEGAGGKVKKPGTAEPERTRAADAGRA